MVCSTCWFSVKSGGDHTSSRRTRPPRCRAYSTGDWDRRFYFSWETNLREGTTKMPKISAGNTACQSRRPTCSLVSLRLGVGRRSHQRRYDGNIVRAQARLRTGHGEGANDREGARPQVNPAPAGWIRSEPARMLWWVLESCSICGNLRRRRQERKETSNDQ